MRLQSRGSECPTNQWKVYNKQLMIPSAKDKTLFTPGPLTTSLDVKQAMLRDAGSWHFEFNAKVQAIREKVLDLAGVSQAAGFECILLQGSGTFGVESVFSTAVHQEGKVLVLANGFRELAGLFLLIEEK